MNDITELAKALNEFQAEIVTVGKTADNPFFKSKYADLGSIMKQSQPVLTKHGLSVIQFPDNLDGQPALTTIVMHTSGQSQQATMPLLLSKPDPQGLGSAITYARRYSYAAALQIVIDDDDDGNKASLQTKPVYKPSLPDNRPTKTQLETLKDLMADLHVTQEDNADFFQDAIGKNRPESKADFSKAIEFAMDKRTDIDDAAKERITDE